MDNTREVPLLQIRSTSLLPHPSSLIKALAAARWKSPSLFAKPNRAHWPGPWHVEEDPVPLLEELTFKCFREKALTVIEYLLYAWLQVGPPEVIISDALLVQGDTQR